MLCNQKTKDLWRFSLSDEISITQKRSSEIVNNINHKYFCWELYSKSVIRMVTDSSRIIYFVWFYDIFYYYNL